MESLCTDSATQLICLREVVLTQLKKGAFFGELAVMFVALANLLLIFLSADFGSRFPGVGMCWDVLGGRVVTGLFLLAVFARICRARHLSAQPQPSQCCPSLERCRNWKAAETADNLNWARLCVCHSLPLYTI